MDDLRKWNTFVLFFSLILPLLFSIGNAAFNVTTIPFNQGYAPLFGDGNLVRSPDGKGVRLLLDRFTGTLPLYIHTYIIQGWVLFFVLIFFMVFNRFGLYLL